MTGLIGRLIPEPYQMLAKLAGCLVLVSIPFLSYEYGYHKGDNAVRAEWNLKTAVGKERGKIQEIRIVDSFDTIKVKLEGTLKTGQDNEQAQKVVFERDLAADAVYTSCLATDSVWNDTNDLYRKADTSSAERTNGRLP